MQERKAERLNGFKNRGNLREDELRRRRDDVAIEIRKQKKEDSLAKRRNLNLTRNEDDDEIDEQFAPLVAGVFDADLNLNLNATTSFRKLLSKERNPPIDQVIQCGVVPRFIQFLTLNDAPLLQFEAAWALTNIASGSPVQTQVVIDQGAVPLFIALLASNAQDVREQAVWALGNIAGDSPRYFNLTKMS